MKKIISLLLVLIVVFSFTTNTLASGSLGISDEDAIDIYGGSSRAYAYGEKNEPNTMDIDVKGYNINCQNITNQLSQMYVDEEEYRHEIRETLIELGTSMIAVKNHSDIGEVYSDLVCNIRESLAQ